MRMKENWQAYGLQMLMLLLGTFLLAFTYYHINFQNGLSEGGFVGLALLGKYLLDLPPALMMIMLDIPILAIAFWLRGRKLIMNTLFASVAFSVFYELCEHFSPLTLNLHNNLALAALLSGIFTGIGAGVVLRVGGATGGDDVLSLLVSEWTGLSIGTVFILMDGIVLGLSLIYLPFAETMFTVMAVLIAGKTITWTVNYGKQDRATLRVPYTVKDKTARV